MQILSSDTPVSVSDRAFNYGDGVFSTLLVENGKAQLLSYHINRLVHDANAIGVHVDPAPLEQAIIRAISSVDDKCVFKVHISSGVGGRGYARDNTNLANVRFSFHVYPTHYRAMEQRGMSLICAETNLAIQPRLAGVKHMNRLEQVLVKQEVDAHNADDAVVCDTQDNIVESSAGNLFFYFNGCWHTPSLKGSGVNGVVRQYLIQALFNENHPLNVGEYSLEQLKQAQAIVVTNALMGVMPVKSVAYPDTQVVEYTLDSMPQRHLSSLLHQQIQSE